MVESLNVYSFTDFLRIKIIYTFLVVIYCVQDELFECETQ